MMRAHHVTVARATQDFAAVAAAMLLGSRAVYLVESSPLLLLRNLLWPF